MKIIRICGKINSKRVYEKLIEIKGRPENKPFPVMCADKKQIEDIAIVDERAEKIIDSFMPGPLTVILKRKDFPYPKRKKNSTKN